MRLISREGARPGSGSVRRLWASLILVALGFLYADIAFAQEMTADEAEDFVRTRWFEGMPEAEARRIGAEGAARIAALLDDPDEAGVHANALLALGLSEQPGAYEAIVAWADQPRSGEIDRATFRAWQALPFALGYVAQQDRRAVARLEAELDRVPGFSFRHQTPARMRDLTRRGAVNALSGSGLPEARAALQRARAAATDPEFRRHIDEADAPARSFGPEVGR